MHPQHGYGRPGWLRNESYCLGMITGWGSHHYDTMHWALATELSGPGRIEARAEFPTNRIWNVHGAYVVELTYPGDIHVSVSDKHPNGLKFYGDDGWIWVTREETTTASDPGAAGSATLPPLGASDARQPIAPARVAHRSNSACIASWIAMRLGRPLTWDPRAGAVCR